MDYNLELYRGMVTSLKRGNYHGVYSCAKPIFLITMLDYSKVLIANQLNWGDSEFHLKYVEKYKEWELGKPTPLYKPFYHLSSEPFYTIASIYGDNRIIQPYPRSLKENSVYAKLDDELWVLLQNDDNREYLKQAIIDQYLKD